MKMDNEITTGIDAIKQEAAYLEQLDQNEDFLINELNGLINSAGGEKKLLDIRRRYADSHGPVNRVRYSLAISLLEGQRISKALVQDLMADALKSQDFKDSFKAWNYFRMFYVFFISEPHNIEYTFSQLAIAIISVLELTDHATYHFVGFSGSRNFGATRVWLAIYNNSHRSQTTAKQLFIEVNGRGVSASFYDRPSAEFRELIRENDDLDIDQLVSVFSEYRNEIAEDIYDPATAMEMVDLLPNQRIFKLSYGIFRGSRVIDYLKENDLIVIHEDTGGGQVEQFNELKAGDYVYVTIGASELVYIAKVTDNEKGSLLDEKIMEDKGWLGRSVDPVYPAIKVNPSGLKEYRKYYMPSGNRTIAEVPVSDIKEINELLFGPYFGVTFSLDREASGVKEETEEHFGQNEKTSLKPDHPTSRDELNRKAFVDRVYEKISEVWGNNGSEPYTIHLNGEWGCGKSSILKLLENNLLKDKWKVFNYNAWENQRFENQWWILINMVSHKFKWTHNWWIFWLKYRGTAIVSTLFIFLAVLMFTYYKLEYIVAKDDLSLVKFYGGIIAFIGTVWGFSSGLIGHFFGRKFTTPEMVTQFSNDPFSPIKRRFNKVVKDRKIAIFIDDVDRCNPEPTIRLLEGVQTLFKSEKVLYVIAGDGNWICQCFEKVYSDFENLKKEGHTLGNNFLEKTFQLTVDVPKISPADKENYIRGLVNKSKDLPGNETKLKREREAEGLLNNAKSIEEIDKISNLEEFRDIENLNAMMSQAYSKIDNKEEIEHILFNYHQFMPSNPRQIIRIINQYTIKRQSLIIEGKGLAEVTTNELIKWVVFSSRWPLYALQLKSKQLTKEGLLNNISNNDREDINALISEIDEYKITQHL